MIIARFSTYAGFKAAAAVATPAFVLFTDFTPTGGPFTAMAIAAANTMMEITLVTKPPTFAADFPTSFQVDQLGVGG